MEIAKLGMRAPIEDLDFTEDDADALLILLYGAHLEHKAIGEYTQFSRCYLVDLSPGQLKHEMCLQTFKRRIFAERNQDLEAPTIQIYPKVVCRPFRALF